MKRDLADYLSPHDYFCCGSFGKPDNPYITAPVLSIGVSPTLDSDAKCSIGDVCSFDAAETESAYIGQTNAIVVSSFCGPHGLIWGMDLAHSTKERHPLLPDVIEKDGQEVIVYSADHLLEASKKLFGTVDEQRFPLWPGTHLPSALKTFYAKGPESLFTALAIGVPQDTNRYARIFMEDVGTLVTLDDNGRTEILKHLSGSVIRVANQQRIKLESIYISIRDRFVEKGETGCALASIPYFLLAKQAVPEWNKSSIFKMSIEEWEKKINKNYLYKQ